MAILRDLSDEQLARVLPLSASDKAGDVPPPTGDRRDWLVRQASVQPSLQHALMRAWRQARSDVVAAARLVPIDGPAEHCEAMVAQFGLSTVLLELITDLDSGHWSLATSVVANVRSQQVQRAFQELLEDWRSSPRTPLTSSSTPARRIAIVGGHVRDENKMHRRLFAGTSYEVRWLPFEKTQGSPDDKDVNAAIAHSEAVLLVTTMVSHNIMRIVKRFTQDRGIPLRAIPKATDQHLRSALTELFPSVELPDS